MTPYDRDHLAIYAELLDADDMGEGWQVAARDVLELDISDVDAYACWWSHLERARWIVGDGLKAAVVAFGKTGERLP